MLFNNNAMNNFDSFEMEPTKDILNMKNRLKKNFDFNTLGLKDIPNLVFDSMVIAKEISNIGLIKKKLVIDSINYIVDTLIPPPVDAIIKIVIKEILDPLIEDFILSSKGILIFKRASSCCF